MPQDSQSHTEIQFMFQNFKKKKKEKALFKATSHLKILFLVSNSSTPLKCPLRGLWLPFCQHSPLSLLALYLSGQMEEGVDRRMPSDPKKKIQKKNPVKFLPAPKVDHPKHHNAF